jgi:hypothetical protein
MNFQKCPAARPAAEPRRRAATRLPPEKYNPLPPEWFQPPGIPRPPSGPRSAAHGTLRS